MSSAERAPRPAPIGVPDGDRPRWSVVIPVYDCAEYLRACLESVLGQLGDPGFVDDDVEIVVVDDGSSDHPDVVVDQVGGGKVRFVRNPVNLGAIGNFNACLDQAVGHYVHLLHGDDLSAPGFYARAGAVFDRRRDVESFVARTRYVDDRGVPAELTRAEVPGGGVWVDALDVLTVSNRVRPPAVAARRSLYEAIGGYRPDLPHAADWEMWVRMASAGPMWFEDAELARYRRHAGSDTAARVLSGENVSERLACIDLLLESVPEERRRTRGRRARSYSALFAARTAARLARAGQWRGGATQLRAAFTCLVAAARS